MDYLNNEYINKIIQFLYKIKKTYDKYLLDLIDINSLLDKVKEEYSLIQNDNKIDDFYKYILNLNIKGDLSSFLKNDPSIISKEEVIFLSPCFFAIFAYRIAHFFYIRKKYFIAKVISEHIHFLTSIDINPGAIIGDNFFIDHGVGIVIGETSIIGNNVKMYHGVTLGASSFFKGKRHPTIKDNVTLYANCSVFGGNTVVGENSIIGTGVIINKSIEPNTIIKIKNNYLCEKKHMDK